MLTERDKRAADRLARAIMAAGVGLVAAAMAAAVILMAYGVYLVIA